METSSRPGKSAHVTVISFASLVSCDNPYIKCARKAPALSYIPPTMRINAHKAGEGDYWSAETGRSNQA